MNKNKRIKLVSLVSALFVLVPLLLPGVIYGAYQKTVYHDFMAVRGYVDAYYVRHGDDSPQGAYSITLIRNHLTIKEPYEYSINMHQRIYSDYGREAPQVQQYLGPRCRDEYAFSIAYCYRYMYSPGNKPLLASTSQSWALLVNPWLNAGTDYVNLLVWVDNISGSKNITHYQWHVPMP